jgi:hypothetical protein
MSDPRGETSAATFFSNEDGTDRPPKVTRERLLAARQQTAGGVEWHAESVNGRLRLRPFWAIRDETYFTYLSL